MSDGQIASERTINLARAAGFRLGAMDVFPPTREIKREAATETLEPRVMQVLVALHRANGAVVSRDDLIASCWDGRIVGDNAIQRTISRLRDIAEGIGSGCFRLETVNKVGYRLVEIEPAPAVEPDRPAPTRDSLTGPAVAQSYLRRAFVRHRFAAAGIALVAIAAGLAIILWQSRQIAAPPLPARSGRIMVAPFAFQRGDLALTDLAQNTEESVRRGLADAGLATVAVKRGQTGDSNAEFEIGGSVGRDKSKVFIDVWVNDRIGGVRAWLGRFARESRVAEELDEKVGEVVAQDLRWTIDLRNSASHPLTSEQLSLLLNASDAVLRGADRERDVTARLVKSAPDFAGSYALRAAALVDYDQTIGQFAAEERGVAAEARASAERAIAMDANSAVAWSALGYRFGQEPRYWEREKALLSALAIKPDLDVARFRYTILLREVGRLDAALELAQHIDNLPFPHLAFLFAMMGDWPEASQVMDRIDMMSLREGADTRWTAAVWWGDPRRIAPEVWQLGYASGNTGMVRCYESYIRTLIAADGRPLHGLPSTCEGLSADALSVDWRIRMLAREGDIDDAYAEMNRAPLPISRNWTMFLFYPEMKAFRRDPRFVQVAERLGLLQYWRKTGQWPDFCAQEGPNPVCAGSNAAARAASRPTAAYSSR